MNGKIVAALVFPDEILDRSGVESVSPLSKNGGLPVASRPAVAVVKRMNELELVVEHATQCRRGQILQGEIDYGTLTSPAVRMLHCSSLMQSCYITSYRAAEV